jgi:multiple sugar transport system permease protein
MAQSTKMEATTPARPIVHRPGRSRWPIWRQRILPFVFVLPAVILVVGMFWYSVIFTVIMSFTNWGGLTEPQFVGLANYIHMTQDPAFKVSLLNTLIWVIGMVILPVGLALAAAILLQDLRGQIIFKNIFYLPYAVGLTSIGVMWTFLLSNNGFSALFAALGLNGLASIRWLTTPPLNTYAMIVAATWQGMGTNMLLFLVGLNGLDRSAIEAARLDGAGGFRLFRYITFPLLRPVTTVIIAMTLVNSLQAFNLIWVMTQGGPYGSSSTLAVWMYNQSFLLYRMGYGSAIAVVLTIIVLGASVFYLRQSVGSE